MIQPIISRWGQFRVKIAAYVTRIRTSKIRNTTSVNVYQSVFSLLHIPSNHASLQVYLIKIKFKKYLKKYWVDKEMVGSKSKR